MKTIVYKAYNINISLLHFYTLLIWNDVGQNEKGQLIHTLTWRRKVKGRNGISGVRAANERVPHAASESFACGSGERRSRDTRLVLMVLELRTPAAV